MRIGWERGGGGAQRYKGKEEKGKGRPPHKAES